MQGLDQSFNASLQYTPSIFSSTPAKKTKRARKPHVFVRPVCDICEYCGREYRCHRSFLKHVKDHKLKDTASTFPDVPQILEYLRLNILAAMKKLAAYPVFGPMKSEYEGLLSDVLQSDLLAMNELAQFFNSVHEKMTLSLQNKKFLLPSTLIAVLQKNAEELLSNIEERKHLCGLIQKCVPRITTVVNIFVGDYILSLVFEILSFISSSLRKARQTRSEPEVTPQLDIEDKEAIHYVSGAVMRSFHKKSEKASADNKPWKLIGSVIHDRLLENEHVPGPPENVKGWTKAQNRGSLFNVSGTMFDLFCGVTIILARDKSTKKVVDHDFVLQEVCNSGLLLLWDEAIADSLPEELAYRVLCGMVRSFCQTYGVGKAKKIMNRIRQKAESSVPLRHRVAPR